MAYTTWRRLAAGHNATVDGSGAPHLFSGPLSQETKLITADRPVRPEATARQRDAPSGVSLVIAGLDPESMHGLPHGCRVKLGQ